MLPGKKYTPEDVLPLLRRHFWLLTVPFALVAAGTAVVARKLPDRYRSEATILVVPQQVPETYVKSAVVTRIEDRLPAIEQQILSRTRLEQIIQELNLYSDERRTGIMQDVVERMRTKDIGVSLFKGDAFKLTYDSSSPRTAMKVTERLASLFIDESLRDRANLTLGTSQFLESAVEDARRKLREHEKKLQDYRMHYSGQLPTQLTANLTELSNTMTQIQQEVESVNLDKSRRLIILRELSDANSDSSLTGTTNSAVADGAAANPAGTTAQQLAAAKQTLAALQLHYSDDWPDVKHQKKVVEDVQRKLDAEVLERPVSTEAPVSPAEQARRKKAQSLQADLDELNKQIVSKQNEEKRLRQVATSIQQRIDVVPARESELTELMRDYDTLNSAYTGLLAKKGDSDLAANLERRQIGEQFKLLDAARIPERPISPDRPVINLMGMAAGLAIGLALVVLLEYRDSSFKTDDDVTRLLELPVLAVVPLMQSDQDRRRAVRRRLLIGIGLGSAVAGSLAIVLYTFVR